MEIAMLEEKIKTAPTHGDVFALLLRIRELTEQADALEAVLRQGFTELMATPSAKG